MTLQHLHQVLTELDVPEEPSPEMQCRLALALLTEAESGRLVVEPVWFPVDSCPNCGVACESKSSPYCSPMCKEESAFVRQFRRALATSDPIDEERQAALGQVFWHILGGGYPARTALIPERVRRQLAARNDGRCELCGQPATSIDHIKTACNRPINLRSVCDGCNRTVPFGDQEFVARSRDRIMGLATRIAAKQPLRRSDDPDAWEWRLFLKERSASL